ncbi:MAG: helix-turn-helix domain-containing protein [Alphaproteobacteria bacterium]|nr:helix-turn-helix domain-containing protein [Alphaproteobacteria bacterium]
MTTNHNQTTQPEPYVSLNDAAEFLGLKPSTLRKWRERGEVPFPCYNIGRRIAFKLSEVDTWARSQAFKSGTEARLAAETAAA